MCVRVPACVHEYVCVFVRVCVCVCMASHQAFSGRFNHLTEQNIIRQISMHYQWKVIKLMENLMSGQFSIFIIYTAVYKCLCTCVVYVYVFTQECVCVRVCMCACVRVCACEQI